MNSTHPDLARVLRTASIRVRLARAIRGGFVALVAAAAIGLLLTLALHLRLIEELPPRKLWLGLLASLIAGALAGALRAVSARQAARLLDLRLGLQDRLTSALELADGPGSGAEAFRTAQSADASRSAAAADLRAAQPLRLPRCGWIGIAGTLLLFGLSFVPTLPVFWSAQQRQEAAEVKRIGAEIVKLAEDTQKSSNQQKLAESAKAAAEAKQIGEAMRRGRVSKQEALVSLDKLTRRMAEAQKRLAEQDAKAPARSADQLKQSIDRIEKEIAKQNAEKQAAAPKSGQKPPTGGKPGEAGGQKPGDHSAAMKPAEEAMKQAADALSNHDAAQMKEAMEELNRQMQSGRLKDGEKQELAQQMKQMAQSLAASGQQSASAQMQQISDAMQASMDPKAMERAAQLMKQISKQMAASTPGKGALDSKQLGALSSALKAGRLSLGLHGAFGFNPNATEPGKGFGAKGHRTNAMKDPGATSPRLLAEATPTPGRGMGKSGAAQELAKYLSQSGGSPGKLPNAKITGTATRNGQELQMAFRGSPGASQSSAPYYQVYQTSKKQAESTLNKENIPAAYKEQVREYFEQIHP